MDGIRRREFIKSLGIGAGLLGRTVVSAAPRDLQINAEKTVKHHQSLPQTLSRYNSDMQTAIGLGNEQASVVDGNGRLRSRNAWIECENGDPPEPISTAQCTQHLEDGYLPIVQTAMRIQDRRATLVSFSSDFAGEKVDYWGIKRALSTRIVIWFPYTCEIRVDNGIVVSGDRILSIFPGSPRFQIHRARYNCLTLTHTDIHLGPPFAGLDSAYRGNRNCLGLNPPGRIEYQFPVTKGRAYYVYVGLMNVSDRPPGSNILDISVGGQRRTIDASLHPIGQPVLQQFVVKPNGSEIRVIAECNPSSTSPGREVFLNGIWVFTSAQNPLEVRSGEQSQQALFYVRCGNELLDECVSWMRLDYSSQQNENETAWFKLPYELKKLNSRKVTAISPESALDFTKSRWNEFLSKGTQFETGKVHLDNLYRTSIINIFLLRKRLPQTAPRPDIYLVEDGPTIYAGFYYRDGSYMINALDDAGYSQQAEESLRIYWMPDLDKYLHFWAQQPDGAWDHPLTEWDGQGQALWALVHHFDVTGDKEWLRKVYPAIRKGAQWIKNATFQTQIYTEKGDKPIFFGLLPIGYGEGIGHGYIYWHDFWAVLGLTKAVEAAKALEEKSDELWMQNCCNEFRSNLRASVEQAYRRVGGSSFIPGDPFNPQLRIFGALAAVYPGDFLKPDDPMVTTTLALMERYSRDNLYTYVKGEHAGKAMWTYITVDWAMCYLLRNQLSMFHKLFDGYVANASPTNGWIEQAWVKPYKGFGGDMPHGWAAANYILLIRQTLILERENKLHLCWGVNSSWLPDGGYFQVTKAPTRFGVLTFHLGRSSSSLRLDYDLRTGPTQKEPQEVILHIPAEVAMSVRTLSINGKVRSLAPQQTMLKIR